MMRRRQTPRPNFPIHIETETTTRGRGPLTGGPLCQHSRRSVRAADHPAHPVPLVCPACVARWRELTKGTTT